MNAKDVALRLSNLFLQEGCYTAMPSPISGNSSTGFQTMSSQDGRAFCSDDVGFHGLSVQSVGYEEGKENGKVHIYVTQGSGLNKLSKDIEGVKVVVNKIGNIKIHPETSTVATNRGQFFERYGRVACGSSCAPSNENYSGTFGALVRNAENKLFILSNNHVLAACNHTPKGMPISSPSNVDSKPGRRAPSEIGRHYDIVELRSGEPTLVNCAEIDAAIAEVTNDMNVSSWQGSDIIGYDTPSTVFPLKSGMRVKKFGRTTGLTFGTVEALVPYNMALPYKNKNFSALVWFKDVWTVRSDANSQFALPGDSGSLVVTEDGGAAVGLLFAGRANYGIIIPIQKVLDRLGNLKLVNGHGI